MTTPTPPHQAAIRAAEKIDRAQCSCDEILAPGSMAQIITREYEGVVSALDAIVKYNTDADYAFKLDVASMEKYGKILVMGELIEKARKALQQLTKG